MCQQFSKENAYFNKTFNFLNYQPLITFYRLRIKKYDDQVVIKSLKSNFINQKYDDYFIQYFKYPFIKLNEFQMILNEKSYCKTQGCNIFNNLDGYAYFLLIYFYVWEFIRLYDRHLISDFQSAWEFLNDWKKEKKEKNFSDKRKKGFLFFPD